MIIITNRNIKVKSLSVTLIFVILWWLLNICGGYLRVHHYWRPIANACGNGSVCLFSILLYRISLQSMQTLYNKNNIIIANTLL